MSRLRLCLYALLAAIALTSVGPVIAQITAGGGGGDAGKQQEEDARAAKRKQEFSTGSRVPLPTLRNAGPCPFAKVLYDAARYVEFKDNHEASADVVYSGEIENVTASCVYKGSEPIKVAMRVNFALGRGPQAPGNHKTYRYWVAVTDRNHAVLDKQWFDLPVTFPAGRDRVRMADEFKGITIPRAGPKVSGANFEILTGFEVTPAMADFNRQGKRFKANAGQSETPTRVSANRP
ncbi:MAG TPA: Tat pathway signal sequence domain protein [Caulobacteraceae bacterium]|jgi:hypothetical protein|nr:Tat pathway signal sequence domain protein [Caulobacteraceae bacterium]